MPKGMGYRGKQGSSGVTPEAVGEDSGVYAYSTRRMAQAETPNIQSWNSNRAGPKRGASIKGPTSAHKGSMSGRDYS